MEVKVENKEYRFYSLVVSVWASEGVPRQTKANVGWADKKGGMTSPDWQEAEWSVANLSMWQGKAPETVYRLMLFAVWLLRNQLLMYTV